jgi:hypothetical protein
MITDDRDLSPETRELLARGCHGHALSESRRRSLKRTLLAQVAAGGVLATTTTAAAWTTVGAKVIVGAVLVTLVGGGVHAVYRSLDASRMAVPTATPAPRTILAPTAIPTATPTAIPVATPNPMPSAMPTAVPVPSPVAKAVADVVPVPIEQGISVTLSPIDTPSTQNGASSPSDVSPSGGSASRPAGSLEAEARLLRDADHALKLGDSATSLRLLDEHAKQYPASALEPERSAERVLALCRAGRLQDARREARAFLLGHPSGPLAVRVQESCGGDGR